MDREQQRQAPILHMNDAFLGQLADAARRQPHRAKWVFVPAHGIGRALGERLALSGTNWINLRFVTPLDIALRMGAPFLVERGIDPSEEGLGPALIMRLLLAMPAQGGYFRPLADQPTMAEALWSTIRELRMAGVRSRDLSSDAFASPAKHAEMRALLAAYEQFLATNNRGDMALVYEEALQHPEWCPIQSQDCWTELPDVVWTPLQRRFIDTMPGDRIVPRALAIPGATMPRRASGSSAERVEPAFGESPLGFLMAPAAAKGKNEPAIELFHAGGKDAEIEEVIRRILQLGAPLDEVEIACAASDYAPLVWEKAVRQEWPVTIGPGLPATFTRPGRAVLAFCEWIESDFQSSNLRRLLQSGDVRFDDSDLTPGQAARLLIKAETTWGRATYELSLTRLAKSYRAAAVNKDLIDEVRAASLDKAQRTERFQDWVLNLVTLVPVEAADGNVALQDCVTAATTFLSGGAARSSALDAAASAALLEQIGELRALGDFRCRLTAALRFIRERVEGLTVAADRARPGHLHVSSLSQAGYSGRAHLFVVGLEEGRVFPGAIEDPVLLDEERAKIHPALRRSKDRIDEAVWAALSRLAAHSGSVSFSYSSRDVREYRDTYPSWLMLQAFRVQQRDASKSYRDLHEALGEAKSYVPETPADAATELGWWLSSVTPAGDAIVPHVLQHFPAIAQGLEADRQRRSPAFTEFDGYVPEAGRLLDPLAIAHGVSPTALEEAAACGFRHFLKRGLRLDAIDDGERNGDVWLDPLTRGAELHDLYASALRRCRDADRRPTRDADLEWLLDTARQRLLQLRVEMPPPSEEVFERESRDFLADLELFLDAECDAPTSRKVIGLEVGFGRSSRGDESGPREPLASDEPIEIDLGRGLTFRLAGRMDRIDQVGPSEFEVIDYKTGGYWAETWAHGVFNGGKRLQHALYGLAAAELLKRAYKKPTVTAGVYYFSSTKGGKERRVIEAQSKEEIAAVLGDLRRAIASGTFIHTADEGECRFCDFARACGAPVAVERVEAKLVDKKLAVRARLAEHA
jgi:RecB family exonuclease